MRLVAALVALTPLLRGETVACVGVLGNSGESGAALVRFADESGRYGGLGAVCDRFGTIWDRAGRGRINRYAPDGRLIAHYRLPVDDGDQNSNPVIALVGDLVVVRSGRSLMTLKIDAASGSEAQRIEAQADAMSPSAHDGKLAIADGGEIRLFDPVTGTATRVATWPAPWRLELGPDGVVYTMRDGKVQRILDAAIDPAWTRDWPGDCPEFAAGAWWANAWHGTVKRYDAALQPDPGVVLGGASGSVIAYMPQNSELSCGRGVAVVGDGLYALSGLQGVLHLARWDGAARQLNLVRRIGALPRVQGLGIDGAGSVWCNVGCWRWDDAPDTPIRLSINAPEEMAQATALDARRLITTGFLWGKMRIYRGAMDAELRDQELALPRGLVATAVVRRGDERTLIAASADGSAVGIGIDAEGAPLGVAVPVVLRFKQPIQRLTSLSARGEDLVACADGCLIELARGADGWSERARRHEIAGERFGDVVHHAEHDGRLWLSDTARHRVVVLDVVSDRVLASFATADHAGDGLDALSSPAAIAVHGRRAVVHDAGNQRLMKLTIE